MALFDKISQKKERKVAEFERVKGTFCTTIGRFFVFEGPRFSSFVPLLFSSLQFSSLLFSSLLFSSLLFSSLLFSSLLFSSLLFSSLLFSSLLFSSLLFSSLLFSSLLFLIGFAINGKTVVHGCQEY